ncbi:MAG: LysM peptidoglycan-binding domain-containing protein [Chloroflexota bacterium]
MLRKFGLVVVLALLGISVVEAQNTCERVVENALEVVGRNCDALSRNTACYGYQMVDAAFRLDAPVTEFTRPADTAELASVAELTTTPYTAEDETWGVAVIHAQLDIPATLPGQAVTMLVLGGASVEDEGGAFPMQAFTFSSGVGAASCDEAPSAMAIRSPEDLQIELTVNGLDIDVGSTVLLETDEDVLTLTVTEGQVQIEQDGTTLNADESIDMALDTTNTVLSWGEPRQIDSSTQAIGVLFGDMFEVVGAQSIVAGNSGVYIVQPGDNLFRIALENNTCVSELARANNISPTQLNAIPVGMELVLTDDAGCGAFVNDLPNLSNPPVSTLLDADAEPLVAINCDGFRVTSPTDGFPLTGVTFYWDGIAEAEAYDVAVYRNGQRVLGTVIDAPETQWETTMDGIPVGLGDYYWTVSAIVEGQVVCTSTSATVAREWPRGGGGDDDNSDDDDNGDNTCDIAALNATASASCFASGFSTWTIDAATCSFVCP